MGQCKRPVARRCRWHAAAVTGINLKEVGALIFPTAEIRKLCGFPPAVGMQQVLQSAAVHAHFQQLLNDLANVATRSANRIARLHLMAESASIDKGETTDKASINQRAVLKHRDALAHALQDGSLP